MVSTIRAIPVLVSRAREIPARGRCRHSTLVRRRRRLRPSPAAFCELGYAAGVAALHGCFAARAISPRDRPTPSSRSATGSSCRTGSVSTAEAARKFATHEQRILLESCAEHTGMSPDSHRACNGLDLPPTAAHLLVRAETRMWQLLSEFSFFV